MKYMTNSARIPAAFARPTRKASSKSRQRALMLKLRETLKIKMGSTFYHRPSNISRMLSLGSRWNSKPFIDNFFVLEDPSLLRRTVFQGIYCAPSQLFDASLVTILSLSASSIIDAASREMRWNRILLFPLPLSRVIYTWLAFLFPWRWMASRGVLFPENALWRKKSFLFIF